MRFKAPAPPYRPALHRSPGHNKPIHRIVIHSTVSPSKPGQAHVVARYFQTVAAGGSAHYVVDPLEVVQSVLDDEIAWHAPPNANSLGVEMCDMPSRLPGRWVLPGPRAVLRRTARLTAELCLAYGVPMDKLTVADLKAGRHGICGHADVSQAFHQSTHWDPGYFPWRRFLKLVRAHAAELVAK